MVSTSLYLKLMAICMLQLHILRDFFPTSDIKVKLGEIAGGLQGRGARKIKTGEGLWGMGTFYTKNI